MRDYKTTLNLPTTEFPMKANLSQREPEILRYWEEIDLYPALRKARKERKKFILHDGPIYANGQIHIGHALNRTLKDIVVKAKTLSGYDVPFVPGWDCHGLPIEVNVEKKYGKAGDKLSLKEFRARCREYASEQADSQREAFIRLGTFADWQHPYLTMQPKYEADILRALAKIIHNGHLEQGFKPVHWCMDCRSALAEAEVEYADKSSPAIDVRFGVVNPEEFLKLCEIKNINNKSVSIPIWTTTPWTLPANEAVAINPELNYVLIETTQEILLLAEALCESAMTRYEITNDQVIKKLSQEEVLKLENSLLQHPLYPQKKVPLIFGDHVTVDAGTGAVHTAPAHGQEDYRAGLHYKLPVNNPVDEKGCFRADISISELAGEFVLKANQKIIDLLAKNHQLLSQKTMEHSYPHCWRHKTPVIFRATPQWFISMEKNNLREQALDAIQKVTWLPEWGEARITGMMKNRPDWCVSRQRNWCMPMALIVDKKTKTLHPDMPALLEKIATRMEENPAGLETWYDLKLEEILDHAENYEKISDTLDVWFDSGVSHFAVLQQRGDLHFPADLYLEGSDQHRGWFQSALLTSVAMEKQAPFRTVLTHGFTVDDKGRKMSKSLGNVIAPEKVINTLGADILRLWVAATDYRAEIAVSDEILKRMAEAYRRIRNTARFLLANLHDFSPDENLVNFSDLILLDQWMIEKASLLQTEIIEAYDNYEFHLVYQKIHQFCIVELGGFYLDIIKDRQYTMQKESLGRRSAQTAIYHVLQALVRWIAPVLSFTAEEIWRYMPVSQKNKSPSVFLAEWYDFEFVKNTQNIQNIQWQKIIVLREEVNKAIEEKRQAGEIGSALEAMVTIRAPLEIFKELEKLGDELRFVLITSSAKIELAKEGGALEISVAPIDSPKCVRCWHRREDVGQHMDHPEICSRCVDNLPEGQGEKRYYA